MKSTERNEQIAWKPANWIVLDCTGLSMNYSDWLLSHSSARIADVSCHHGKIRTPCGLVPDDLGLFDLFYSPLFASSLPLAPFSLADAHSLFWGEDRIFTASDDVRPSTKQTIASPRKFPETCCLSPWTSRFNLQDELS